MSVGDARVYTYKYVYCTLSCTCLQNYTIGASLMSVSVSVPWNLSYHSYSRSVPARQSSVRVCMIHYVILCLYLNSVRQSLIEVSKIFSFIAIKNGTSERRADMQIWRRNYLEGLQCMQCRLKTKRVSHCRLPLITRRFISAVTQRGHQVCRPCTCIGLSDRESL